MIILNKPKCCKEDCQELAIAHYAGLWYCGRHFEKLANNIAEKRRKEALEITEGL